MPPEKLRILIIDDEECIRDSLAMHLTARGHDVLTYPTARKCPAFRQHNCHLLGPCADLVLVDQNMPDMSGLDFLRFLTRHGCQIVPPNRIIMTGNVTDELEQQVHKLGCGIIQKPLRLDTLDELVKKASVYISSGRILSDLD